jgi:hypothetical protein
MSETDFREGRCVPSVRPPVETVLLAGRVFGRSRTEGDTTQLKKHMRGLHPLRDCPDLFRGPETNEIIVGTGKTRATPGSNPITAR